MIVTLDIPFDEFSSFLRGPALGPAKIREAFHSDSSNYFTERGVNLKDHPRIMAWKNTALPSGVDAIGAIEQRITEILTQHDQVLSLGGDHSVTYPIVKGFAKKYKKLNLLHIDAHPDLYDEYEGNKFSHACPFARIMENGLAQRLVQVGIRTMSSTQREQVKRFGVEVVEMKDWDSIRRFEFDGPLYISLDMDAIDPAFAPGVSHHEPGGFSSRDVISILQNIRADVVGSDIVELNPARDPSGITTMLAAKLFKEQLDLLLRSGQ